MVAKKQLTTSTTEEAAANAMLRSMTYDSYQSRRVIHRCLSLMATKTACIDISVINIKRKSTVPCECHPSSIDVTRQSICNMQRPCVDVGVGANSTFQMATAMEITTQQQHQSQWELTQLAVNHHFVSGVGIERASER